MRCGLDIIEQSCFRQEDGAAACGAHHRAMIEVAAHPRYFLGPPPLRRFMAIEVNVADDDDVGALPVEIAFRCDLQAGARAVRSATAGDQGRLDGPGQCLRIGRRVAQHLVEAEGCHRPAFRQNQDRGTERSRGAGTYRHGSALAQMPRKRRVCR